MGWVLGEVVCKELLKDQLSLCKGITIADLDLFDYFKLIYRGHLLDLALREGIGEICSELQLPLGGSEAEHELIVEMGWIGRTEIVAPIPRLGKFRLDGLYASVGG